MLFLLPLIAVIVIAGWFGLRGERRLRDRFLGLAALALAVALLVKGAWLPAMAAGGFGLWSLALGPSRSGASRASDRRAAALLGLDPLSAPGPDQIRAAYRARAPQVHPDRGGSADAMRELADARDRLLRRGKRG